MKDGNQNGVKLKDPHIRQLAYSQYCDHLSQGKSKRSWCFQHDQHSCSWETMEKYLKDIVEFDPIHKEIAMAKGFAIWEQIVEDSAKGLNPNANTASLQMIMRNKYGWDSKDKHEEEKDTQQDEAFRLAIEWLLKTQCNCQNNKKNETANAWLGIARAGAFG